MCMFVHKRDFNLSAGMWTKSSWSETETVIVMCVQSKKTTIESIPASVYWMMLCCHVQSMYINYIQCVYISESGKDEMLPHPGLQNVLSGSKLIGAATQRLALIMTTSTTAALAWPTEHCRPTPIFSSLSLSIPPTPQHTERRWGKWGGARKMSGEKSPRQAQFRVAHKAIVSMYSMRIMLRHNLPIVKLLRLLHLTCLKTWCYQTVIQGCRWDFGTVTKLIKSNVKLIYTHIYLSSVQFIMFKGSRKKYIRTQLRNY